MQERKFYLKAYGKINLYLDVLGRRKDGYHYIYSMMQNIGIADEIIFERIKNPSNKYCFIKDVGLEFCMKDSTILCDENNLAIKGAAKVLESLEEKEPGTCRRLSQEVIRIEVTKKIPVAAGLAGGSADAAVVMIGLNELAGSILTVEELMKAGIEVGSDVPFSIMMNVAMNEELLKTRGSRSCAAIVKGIGETVIPTLPVRKHVVLINPGVPISTKMIYGEVDRCFCSNWESDHQRECYEKKKDFYNIIEDCTISLSAKFLRDWMCSHMNADIILMSGSGPTMVAYYEDEKLATKYAELAKKEAEKHEGWRVFKTVSGGR